MNDKSKELKKRGPDYVAATIKSILGALPCVGPAIAEIVENVIPNQRIDRLADFAQRLESKVQEHQAALLQKRLLEPEGTDRVCAILS